MAEQARFINGKKYMWDGEEYDSKKKAKEAQKQYEENGFDVELCNEDDKVLLYTRRVITEIVVE